MLTTPAQVRNAVTYVLRNFAQHAKRWGEPVPAGFVDPYSSESYGDYPAPHTWLLDVGWRGKTADFVGVV